MSTDNDIAFPVLTDADLSALSHRGRVREVPAGQLLWEEGARNLAFYVVLKGAIEITGSFS